jgi:hypothetical protein
MRNVSAIRGKSASPGDKFQNSPRHPKSEHKVLQRLVKSRSDTGNEGQGLERIFDGIVFNNGNSITSHEYKSHRDSEEYFQIAHQFPLAGIAVFRCLDLISEEG